MYQLPLRFIKLSESVAVCATRIVAIMSTDAFQARETIKEEKRAGRLINASGKNTTKAAVFLDNGTVIASPLSVTCIMNAIERSNAKSLRRHDPNLTKRMRVYDVVDESANEALDDDYTELSANADL